MRTELVFDLPEAAYHADPCDVPSLSASIAHVLDRKSPLHAWAAHPRLGKAPRTFRPDFEMGSLVHTLVLGAGSELVQVEADDWRTKAAREKRDQARADGKIPLLVDEYDAAMKRATSIGDRIAEAGFRLTGRSEVSAFWGEDGVQCRARIDHLLLRDRSATVFDLKTTKSGRPEDCARSIDAYGYAIQHAAYSSAIEHVRPTIAGRVEFVFLFAELEPPHSVTPVMLSGAFASLGERRWRRAVELWRRCLERNEWPGYGSSGPVVVAPPTWAEIRDQDREAEEAAAAE